MHLKPFIRVLMLIACLFSAAQAPLPAYGAEPIKIGVLAFPSKTQAKARWQPLAGVLKQVMPERDFVVVALSSPELDQAVAARQLDFVLTNGGQYLLLKNRNGLSSPLATLATDVAGQSLTVYGGVIFSRAGQADINTLSDIKGKTVAAVATESQGAYQMQTYEFSRVGIRLPQDVKLITTGLPHDQVVAAVLAGRAEVGFVRSGVLEGMVREGKLDIKQLKILNRQDLPEFPLQVSTRLYPEWPFAAMPHIDEKLARHVAAALFELEDNTAATRAMGIHGFVVPADYSPVEDVLRELRMPPFEVAPRFTLHDVWRRYRWQTLGALLAGGVILSLGVSVLLMYRRLAANHKVVLLHQQKLQESEEKFRTVADYTYAWEIWEDPAGSCLYCSPSCERVTGYSSEAFMADSGLLARLIHPEDLPLWKAHYDAVHDQTEAQKIAKGAANKFEFRILLPDGEVRWISHLCYHVHDAEGHDLGHRISNRDITEYKQTSEALRQSDEKFRALVESTSDWIWEVDRNKHYTYVSPRVEMRLGYKPEEVLGKSPFDFMPPDEAQAIGKVFGESIAKCAPFVGLENTNLHKDGRLVVLETSGVPFFDPNGEFAGYRGIDRDITERKQTAQALAEANVLLGKELAERKATEQELQSVNEQLSILLDSLPIAIYRCWAEGDFAVTYMSHNVVTVTGYESRNFIEDCKLWFTHIHPDDAPRVDSELTILFEKGKNAYEYRWLAADGSYRWIEDSQRLIRPEDGTPSYMVGIWQDITARKQVAEAQRKANDDLSLFRTLLDNSSDAIEVIDPVTLRYLDVNETACRELGYSREELLAMSIHDIDPDFGTDAFYTINEKLQKSGSARFETNHRRKDGSTFPVEVSMGSVTLDKPYGLGIVRDITERKQAVQALTEAELRFKTIFNAAIDGIVVVDAQSYALVTANSSFCDMLGYQLEELTRLGIEDIHPAAAFSEVRQQIRRQLKGEIRVASDLPVQRKDGSVFFADVSSAPMVLAGRPLLVGVFHDVTERKQVEEKIRKLNEGLEEKIQARTQQLQEAQEELVRKEKLALLGQIVGSVGHELRNPLGAMNNAVYFLQTVLVDADETIKEYLNIIKDEIADADRIVSDLLDAVRSKPPQPEAVGGAELIGQTLRKCSVPPSVSVKLGIPASLPSLWVDPMQIQQVFRNLISNGVEAMPEGGTLAISAVENRQEGTVTVSVRDSGSGITPEVLAKLFQPLFTTKARGIGLGLVVVKNLTQVNGGTIRVQSEIGQGATFIVTLPTINSSIEVS